MEKVRKKQLCQSKDFVCIPWVDKRCHRVGLCLTSHLVQKYLVFLRAHNFDIKLSEELANICSCSTSHFSDCSSSDLASKIDASVGSLNMGILEMSSSKQKRNLSWLCCMHLCKSVATPSKNISGSAPNCSARSTVLHT